MKGYRYFIDTNIFLRVLVQDDEKTFPECLKLLEKVRQNQIQAVTSVLVLAEINWTLLRFYKFPKERVVEGIRSISVLKNLTFIERFHVPSAIALYQMYSVKFIDALIVSSPLVVNREMKVISYDTDFDKLKVERVEPGELV